MDVYDGAGRRRTVTLGPWGSEKANQELARLIAERSSPTRGRSNLTVAELLVAYLDHAEAHYRAPDGSSTGEVAHVRAVIRHVRELYGHTPAAEFGPLALKAVRQRFIDAGWCRKSVNQQTERARRAFKWAAAEELIPFETYHRLTAVTGLRRGRTTAHDPEPVGPVEDAVVDATLPHLNRHVAGLVQFQRLTGCRPGEACRVRMADIDTTGDVWLYRPAQHKGAWRGKVRTIPIGPRGQALLREFTTDDPTDYLFSPRRAVEEVRADRAAARQTPRYPSHMKRNEAKRKAEPERTPAPRYGRTAYFNAVSRATDRAFPPTGQLARREGESLAKWRARLTAEQRTRVKAWQKAHRWAPNQLRHSRGTAIRQRYGLEGAGAALGHDHLRTTEIYAEKNLDLAKRIASEIG